MEVQNSSRYGALVKVGQIQIPGINDSTQGAVMDARRTANRRIWQMLAAGLGLGMLTRGGIGLTRLMASPPNYDPEPSYQDVSLQLPSEEEEKTAGVLSGIAKGLNRVSKEGPVTADPGTMANPAASQSSWPKTGPLASVSNFVDPREWAKTTEDAFTGIKGGPAGFFFGDKSTTAGAVPAMWALGIPAMAAGFGGSYMLADKLLDWRRKSELKARERRAKKEYQKLLDELMAKRGSDDASIEDALDELADLCFNQTEKQAQQGAAPDFDPNAPASTWWNAPGAVTGLLASYALLSAIASGKVSYDYFRKRSPQRVTEEALRRRSKERTGGMAPIQLSPGTGLV